MKRILLLSLLCLSLTGRISAQCNSMVTTYPYLEDFEAGAGGWTSGGTNSTWALGKPAKTIINSAASGTKSWVTSLTGTYSANEHSYVEGPCFNFSNIATPVILMKIWWETESGLDGAVLQSSIDDGATWQNVGAFGDPNNWYNYNMMLGAPGNQAPSNAEGWTGYSSYGSKGWVTAKHYLTGLGGQYKVKLRIAFGSVATAPGSVPTTQRDGFAFDDIKIYDASSNDVGVIAVTSPVLHVPPGSSHSISVAVKNFGTAPIAAIPLSYKITAYGIPANGPFTEVMPGSISPGATATYTFTTKGNLSAVHAYSVCAWTNAPNDMDRTNDSTCSIIYVCTSMAGNYTINKNAAASATNFQSFAAVAQELNTCGISAPVTITVAPGTGPYNEQFELTTIPGTSATNTVTFEGNGNTITNAIWGLNPAIIRLNGADHVKLNNLTLTVNAGSTSGWGVQLLNGADFNTISNCTINLPQANNSGYLDGIIAGSDLNKPGNNTSNSSFLNNTINGGYFGIQLNGNANGLDALNNKIIGNKVKDFLNYGISVNDADGTIIEENELSRPSRTNVEFFVGIDLSGITANTIINKNRIFNTNGAAPNAKDIVYGMHIRVTPPAGSENIIKNNLLYNFNPTSATIYGIFQSGSGAYFFNNTISIDNPAWNGNTLYGYYAFQPVTNTRLFNNIISINAGGLYGTKHAIYISDPTSGITSDNNVLYISPGTANGFVGYYNASQATLADWKSVNANAYDQHSVSTDPGFVSLAAGNLQPYSSGVNNIGLPLPAVTDDITGATRNTTTPDPGAYEFSPLANDVGILSYSSPKATNCGSFSSTETVTVTIKNFGTNTQASIPVSLTVDAVAPITETFAGPLAPNAIAVYTFTTKANLSATGPHKIIAKTLLPGDANANNDGDTLNIFNALTQGSPNKIDFETPATGLQNLRAVTNPKSDITVGSGAYIGPGSNKVMIMDGVSNPNWIVPIGFNDPWTNNINNFSAAYICLPTPQTGPNDSLQVTFDLKQLFNWSYANTNFRVTVNGTQAGPTFRPPFSGTPIQWKSIKIDMTAFKNAPTLQIGFESSVKEEYANGTGPANLVDNIQFMRYMKNGSGYQWCDMSGWSPFGLKKDALQSQLHVFPNPSKGTFNIDLPKGNAYQLEVTDLTGKVIKTQTASSNAQLNLEGTAKGIYLLKVSGENGSAVRKLIIE